MKRWLHGKALQVFLSVLAVYVPICCTVTYAGVKITYVAGPVLVVSGLTALLTRPKGALIR